jgi:DNA-binding SARP family transcriptional activator
MGDLSFRLLGEFRAVAGGRELDITRHQQRCVLVALLVDVNQAVSTDTLAYRVWGDDPPRRPKEALYSLCRSKSRRCWSSGMSGLDPF